MVVEARKTGEPGLPKRVGRYEPFLQIGAGGMARVYLAVQRGLAGQKAELVVVKILRPEVVEDEHVLALFTDEARIAMRLEHPNVIRTREVIAAPPDYLLAMDFQDGRSLLDVVSRLGRQAVPLDEHIHVLSKVLAGLSYAHELKDEHGRPFGIVHRDVSPANVLVTYTGEVKLLDFGIAKATGALAATRDGVVKGKLGYAAPEQCLGQPADPRSDIYAVGVMLWEAIAGRRRVSGETWQSVLQARLDDSEPALEEVCPDAPPALTAIVRKAVARDPNDRYPTARAFQGDLEKFLREKRGQAMDLRRVAAMLKPHFDQDRADMRRSVESFLNTLKSGGKNGPVGRLPLPGGRPAAPAAAPAGGAATPVALEESTAPIPVDAALLMASRGESAAGPESSTPTAPPPPPTSLAVTTPPPAIPATAPLPISFAATAPVAVAATAPSPVAVAATAPSPVAVAATAPSPVAVAATAPSPVAVAATAPSPTAFTTTAPPPPDVVTPTASAARPSDDLALPLTESASPSLAFLSAPSETAVDSVGAASATPTPTAARALAFPAAMDAYGLVAAPSPVATPQWPSGLVTKAQPKKKTPVWPFLLLGVGAIGIAGVVLAPKLKGSTEHAAAPATAPVEPAPAPKPRAAPAVDTVKVRISVDPADALVELDGQTLSGNPFVAALPRDNVDHVLTASAEGCHDQKQTVHLNGDLAVLVAMKCQRQGLRLSGKPMVRRPSAATAASPTPQTPAAATPTPPAAPPPEPAKEPAAPASDENPYK